MHYSWRICLFAALVVLVLLAVSLRLVFNSSAGVTRANFDRIEIAMQKSEVDALLGRTDSEPVSSSLQYVSYSDDNDSKLVPGNRIQIAYESGKVCWKEFNPWEVRDVWNRIKGRLGI
jgi:hypothetical protein